MAHDGEQEDLQRARPLLYIIVVLLIASVVSWRQATYFSGALDPVVLLKGFLSGIALLLAWYAFRLQERSGAFGARTLAFALLYLFSTCIGGWAAGSTFASAVVASRVAILLITLVLLLGGFKLGDVILVFVRMMTLTAALAILTGIKSAGGGRLVGGLPPLTPNELAFLCGVPAIYLLSRVVSNGASKRDLLYVLGLVSIVYLTGSRTGVAALIVAMVIMILQAKILSLPVFVALVAVVPITGYVILSTSTVSELFSRGGPESVTTLSSRTIAWGAALDMNASWWQTWFGGGLSMKHIPVSGQYWSTQILDSSWISALVQGGLIGFSLTILWALTTIVASLRGPRSWRPFFTALLVFVVGRSFLESGLFDATTALLLFAIVSVATEPMSRRLIETERRQDVLALKIVT